MKDIVVEVKQGIVVGVYSDIDDARFVVVDWDLLEDDELGSEVGVVGSPEKLKSLSPAVESEYRRAVSA